MRIVHDVSRALPTLPIIGVGGISTGAEALELIRAGRPRIQVGTANFDDPRATTRILTELAAAVDIVGVPAVSDLVGAVG